MNKIFDINAKEFGDFIILDIIGVPLMALGVTTKAKYNLTIKDYATQTV